MKTIRSLLLFIFAGIVLFGQEELILDSDLLPYPDTSIVYLPSGYGGTTLYAAVVLLHGWTGDQYQWSGIIDLKKISDEFNFIIICPNGYSDSWYADNAGRENLKWESFFMKEFLPHIMKSYNINTGKLFITGLSMGGHGAVSLLLKYPPVFTAAGSTSGILDIEAFAENDRWNLSEAFGEYPARSEYWSKNNSIDLLDKFDPGNPIIIDCGIDDFAYPVNKAFYEKCVEKKMNVKFISQPGNHSRSYWAKSIIDHLRFFKDLSQPD